MTPRVSLDDFNSVASAAPPTEGPGELPAPATAARPRQLVDGADFVFSEPEILPALWGSPEAPAWTAGEGLMLVGPQGVGKTSLAQQLALARIGLREHVLAMPVVPDPRPVLYIAADRPRQAARSLRRMVSEADADLLRERLLIWRGPLPFHLTDHDGHLRFAEALRRHEVGTVVVDSLKDVAAKLTDDEAGGRINFALQAAIAEGVETIVAHHQRKASSDNKRPNTLADVYGSNWITAGQGSVVLLWGEAGDPIVRLAHLKQPAGEVGPFDVLHDHERGVSTLREAIDLEAFMHGRGADGVSAKEAAIALFGSDKRPADVEKARRRLEKLVGTRAVKLPAAVGGEARYLYDGGKRRGNE